jgi:Winged helix DNA-binding domain
VTTAAAKSSTKAPEKPALRLDPARVNAWRVERQLLGKTRAASPDEVATTLLGVQAQVVSSAALAIALRSKPARGKGSDVAATAQALAERRLVRSWAMRGTLHLFAAEDVPTIAAALGGKDRWRRPAWLRWFGVTEREMDALIDAIGEVLDDGRPKTRAELADEIGTRLGEKAGKLLLGSWGSALKVASDRHYLCQSAEDDAGVRFVRASRWIKGWREEDQGEALAKLVVRYLAAYGPATLREVLRWWGVARVSVMRPVFERLGDAVVEVDVAGRRAYVRTEDLIAIEATRATRRSVRLVGGFDPFIVGAGLREQLIPAKHLKRVSRTAGWISPVVLVDGVAAGVWDARRSGDRLAITIEPFVEPSPRRRASIESAAREVGRVQDLPVSVVFGSVFPAKPSKVPFNDRG